MDTPLQTLPAISVPNDATGVRVVATGRWVKLVSCTTPNVRVGFDGGAPQRMYPGDCYPGPENGFRSLWLLQDGGACTAVVHVANQPINGGDVITVPAMAANIALMQAALAPGSVITPIADVNVAIVGGAATIIKAANAARKRIVLFGDPTMAGLVYLGPTGAAGDITTVKKMGVLTQYGMWSETYTGAIYGVGSDALQIVCGYELS